MLGDEELEVACFGVDGRINGNGSESGVQPSMDDGHERA